MNLRWHLNVSMCGVLFALLFVCNTRSEDTGSNYVPDPAVEQAINDALSPDKAVAYPAIKKLADFGGASRRALENRLFNEKAQRTRVQLAEIIARACEGRVAYRITLELSPDGSGKLKLESDRNMLAECARKYDRILGNPPTVYPEDVMRNNPYSRSELAKHMDGGMKYVMGESATKDGRIIASGEVAFTTFDEFAAFASSFDRSGYYMLNGMTLTDANNIRTLHFKKNPDQNTAATRYLLLFHDVKWEFVLDFKGTVQNSNAISMARSKHVWTFNCAQMLTGEVEVEASFDPRQSGTMNSAPGGVPQNATPVAKTDPNEPVAVVANKVLSLLVGKRNDDGVPITRGPDYEVVLDGRPSTPQGPDLKYQWQQTSGIPLNLPKDRIAIPLVKMLIYQPGEYRFELVVSKGEKLSPPAEVLVLVGENAKPELPRETKIIANAGGEGGTVRRVEVDFGDRKIVANPRQVRSVNEQSNVPESNQKTFVSVPVNTTGNRLELDLIRQVEDEFARNLASGGTTHHIVVPNSLAPANQPLPPVKTELKPDRTEVRVNIPNVNIEATKTVAVATLPNASQTRLSPPTRDDLPPAPAVPNIPGPGLNIQSGEAVVMSKGSLEEIRRTEEQFNDRNAAKPATQSVQPTQVEPVLKPVTPEPQVELKQVETPLIPVVKVPPTAPDANKELKDFENALKKTGADKNKKIEPLPSVPVEEAAKESPTKNPAPVTPANPAKALPSNIDTKQPEAAAVASGTGPAPALQVGNSLAEGVALIKAGQYAAAVATLKKVNTATPSDEAKTQLAIATFYLSERPDSYDRAGTMDAMNLFEDVIRNSPKNATLLMYYGHCNARFENMQAASKVYREGVKIAGDAVRWESMWQLANKFIKAKDYDMALTMLKDAEEIATKANVKDVRLERDFAVAQHGKKNDVEAVKRAQNVLALGCALDPKLAEELKISGAPATANSQTPTPALEIKPKAEVAEIKKPLTEELKPVVPAKTVAEVKPEVKEVAKAENATKAPPTQSEIESRFDALLKERDAEKTAGGTATPQVENKATPPIPTPEPRKEIASAKTELPKPIPPVPPPVAETKLVPPSPPVRKQVPEVKKTVEAVKTVPTQSIEDLEKRANELIKSSPSNPKNSKSANAETKPARVMRKLPPVPGNFEAALATGKHAIENGLKVLASAAEKAKAIPPNKPEEAEAIHRAARISAQDDWDEAEAMLRGAWAMRSPANEEEVRKQFIELSKQIGAIALVSSQNLIAKKNGLVVLNAEPSVIYPTDKPLFYAWDQVKGPDLGPDLDLRRENLATKKLGLRIKDPGIYKFELVVSDGQRGGNPVTVTVEVQDNRAQ